MKLRKPYGGETETITINSLNVQKAYGGALGRYMDITYESYAGTTEPTSD